MTLNSVVLYLHVLAASGLFANPQCQRIATSLAGSHE
jgi:hypothetical protein